MPKRRNGRRDLRFDFYAALCAVKGVEVRREVYARWQKMIRGVLAWLAQAGIDQPEVWLASRSADFSVRGMKDWWVPALLVEAMCFARKKELAEHERLKSLDSVGRRGPRWEKAGTGQRARWVAKLHSAADLADHFNRRMRPA